MIHEEHLNNRYVGKLVEVYDGGGQHGMTTHFEAEPGRTFCNVTFNPDTCVEVEPKTGREVNCQKCVEVVGRAQRITGRFSIFLNQENKCLVNGCRNYKGERTFRGDVCEPCWNMLYTGNYNFPTENFISKLLADRNRWKNEAAQLLELSENLDEHPEGYEGACLCQECQRSA